VKLLFDQNLSHRLPGRLSDLFPNSTHVRTERLDQSADDYIWNFAKSQGYAIVTFDADFVERSRLYGGPPKVIWLCCGNATRDQVEALLRRHAGLIMELIQNPDLDYVELQ
jgi:predicted nuclease of predicted toxin-antitoxin system